MKSLQGEAYNLRTEKMNNQDNMGNEAKANIWTSNENQPYAQRSVRAFTIILFVVLAVGGFVTWYFFISPDNGTPVNSQAAAQRAPGNEYDPQTGQSSFYNFFHKVFSGIGDGLDTSRMNIGEPDDEFRLEALSEVEQQAEKLAPRLDDGFQYSMKDVVGSRVMGEDGNQAGQVHDIVIDKETGEAQAIIVDKDGTYHNQGLSRLTFENVQVQDPSGAVLATLSGDDLGEKPRFSYADMGDKYISLRHLRDGQVLDHNGDVAGQVSTVIYQNAEVQRVLFALKPSLTGGRDVGLFGFPYENVTVVENPDGYDIQLTEEQTRSLASSLYGDTP